MGKKKVEIMKRIEDFKQRRVAFCKRKKGMLKKSMELSLLCDVSVFAFIYDKEFRRVIHYASDANENLLDLFNQENHREFYTNMDYIKVGGKLENLECNTDKNWDNQTWSKQAMIIDNDFQSRNQEI